MKFIKQNEVKKYTRTTEWYHSSIALSKANDFESIDYFIVYSKQKPIGHPWGWDNNIMLKIGSSSGKGFGMSDDSMSNKFRTKRRKGTSQPKDRLGDHLVIMRDGPAANQIKKNIGNLASAWAPVFDKYGYGPKLLTNVWVCFLVPTEAMNFRDSSMFCEWLEIISINEHIHKFQGSAPLADLKYQSYSDKERRVLCLEKEKMFKARSTRFANDDDYIDKITNNSQNFNSYPADLERFFVK
jgi:hypothetical protein